MKVNMVLFLCLALIQIIDTGITIIVLNCGGVELNPIMAFYMNKFGNAETMIFIKVFLLTLILVGVIKNVRYIRAGLVTTCGYYVIGLSLAYLFL
jgi:hypothetical protein